MWKSDMTALRNNSMTVANGLEFADGGEPLGLRREAQRHAAFARPHGFAGPESIRLSESGVAAPALPPQSKTSRNFHHLQIQGRSYFEKVPAGGRSQKCYA